MKLRQAGALVKESAGAFSDHQAMSSSAAIAFYTMFSVAPLLVIAVGVAGLVFGQETARQEVIQHVQTDIGPGAAKMITEAMHRTQPKQSIWAIVVGGAILLLGASAVFDQLQTSLNTVWNVKPQSQGAKGIVRTRLLAFLMVFCVGLVLLGMLAISTVLAAVESLSSTLLPLAPWVWKVMDLAASLAVLVVLFAAVFKWVPDVRIRWRDVWFGALVTAALFVAGKFGIGYYLGHSSITSTYGAAGSLAALLAWVYYSAMIFFFGAEVTRSYAHVKGREVTPSRHAQWVDQERRAA